MTQVLIHAWTIWSKFERKKFKNEEKSEFLNKFKAYLKDLLITTIKSWLSWSFSCLGNFHEISNLYLVRAGSLVAWLRQGYRWPARDTRVSAEQSLLLANKYLLIGETWRKIKKIFILLLKSPKTVNIEKKREKITL